MKVGNKLLNRIVAVGILAVILICYVSVAYASEVSSYRFFLTRHFSDGGTESHIYTTNSQSGDKLYVFYDRNKLGGNKSAYYSFVFVREIKNSSERIKNIILTCEDKNCVLYKTKSSDSVSSFSIDGKDLSFCLLYGNNDDDWNVNSTASYSVDHGSLVKKYGDEMSIAKHLLGVVYGVEEDPSIQKCSSDSSSDALGSQDNPIEKSDFGYPQVYNSTYIHNDPNNLETLDKLYSGQDFQWKKKTTTGFDLTNNDYNYTYIECKVKANYQYNDKFSGKGSWHDFASYGEMGNLGKVRAESLSHYYTFQEFQEALPKTSNELPDHKMRAIKSSAVYYFRVVCMKTSSTVVIPDEKDCKYYAGPWRSITVTKINGKDGTSIVEDGDMDENGEWKKDDSSNDNGKDIDNGSAEGDDLSDASDKAHETINSNANKSTLDLDSAKAFINQVADVPKMIADIFSFLPDWVKYSFAFGFALIPILIIFKLIRG